MDVQYVGTASVLSKFGNLEPGDVFIPHGESFAYVKYTQYDGIALGKSEAKYFDMDAQVFVINSITLK